MKTTPRRYARRSPARPEQNPRNRRLIAVLATLGVFGALVAVTQVSLADTRGKRAGGAPCPPATATASPGGGGTATPGGTGTAAPGTGGGATAVPEADASAVPDRSATADGDAGAATGPTGAPAAADGASPVPTNGTNPSGAPYRDNGAVQHPGDGQQAGSARRGNASCSPSSAVPGTGNTGGGLEVLANNCDESRRQPHDGFQLGDRCVSTEFGEVGNAADNPSLLITSAPRQVARNQAFTLAVSTRNLVRDRFLPAAQGGYYKESSLLTEDGLVRGHFHTACRMLSSGRSAPAPDPAPAFFVATEDGKGSATPDTVRVTVPGLPQRGMAQCAVWAGDGSHRIPMMQRANQVPAFDVVRIQVR